LSKFHVSRISDPGSRILHPTACIIAALLFVIPSIGDDKLPGKNLAAERFTYRGDGYLIIGKEAKMTGKKLVIKGAQAQIQLDDDKVVVFTPEFTFDTIRKYGSSDKRINIRSRNMTISGTGFDIDFEKQRVVIRRNVHVKLVDFDTNLLGNDP
jgi:hypothetical protein